MLSAMLQYGPKTILRAETLEELSRAYQEERNASGLGASEFGPAIVRDADGSEIARISYNGRVWPAEPWRADLAPIMEAAKL